MFALFTRLKGAAASVAFGLFLSLGPCHGPSRHTISTIPDNRNRCYPAGHCAEARMGGLLCQSSIFDLIDRAPTISLESFASTAHIPLLPSGSYCRNSSASIQDKHARRRIRQPSFPTKKPTTLSVHRLVRSQISLNFGGSGCEAGGHFYFRAFTVARLSAISARLIGRLRLTSSDDE